MPTLYIEIELDNATFQNENEELDCVPEVTRILKKIIDSELMYTKLKDINGNTVGRMYID